MLVVFSMKGLTYVLRLVVCLMLNHNTVSPAYMPSASKPHWLKWWKLNLMLPSPVMKLPKNRFNARLFVLTAYEHLNFAILCLLVKS